MNRLWVNSLWTHRKEAASLVYLFLVGMAFGAIWIFYDSNSGIAPKAENTPAFEEGHGIADVVISDPKKALEPGIELRAEAFEVETMDLGYEAVEQAWKANAVKVAGYVDDMPQISIVIDDLGVVRDRTLDIINLDMPLTLSFLPYAPDLKNVTRFARGRGHELMIHLPMEPKGDKNPGPHALLTGAPDHEILQELSFNLSQFDGYVGFNNHMGSAFTEDPEGLDLILNEAQQRGLLVLDSRTTRKSLLAKMATGKNIPNVTRDFFLDNEQDVAYIRGQLAKLENLARIRGHAIAIGHPYAETIEALSAWLPTLKEKGIAVVPLSHIVKKRYEQILLVKERMTSSSAH